MQNPSRQEPAVPYRPSYDLTDYLGVLRRGWWLLLAGLLIGVAGAAGITATQTKVYEAATSVLVLPTGSQDPELTGGRNQKNPINLDTEAQLVRSMATAAVARKLLKSDTPAAELRRNVSVTVPPNTAILEITYAAETPQAARAGSHAFAEAYLTNRKDNAEAELGRQVQALQTQIKGVQKQLRDVTAKLTPDRADSGYLNAQQQNLSAQLNDLTSRLNALRASGVHGGRIISEAQLPESPTRPDTLLNLAAGVMLGLLLGVAAALAWQHTDRRVSRGADVTRRAGVPLLAELTDRQAAGSAPSADAVFGAFTPAGRLFSRLRNEVVASLESRQPAIVVVTGACRGPAAPTLAANLAVAFTRAGNDVALVYADVPGAWEDTSAGWAPATRLFGAPAAPGLSEVLAGRAGLYEALVPAARHRNLRVLPTGSTATSAGLLQAETVRHALTSLRDQAEYVIVHAPSTAESADAQSLAIHADVVLLAVDLGRATDLQVADAAEQLRRVGTPLLGAVALPAIPPAKPKPAAPEPATMVLPKITDGEHDEADESASDIEKPAPHQTRSERWKAALDADTEDPEPEVEAEAEDAADTGDQAEKEHEATDSPNGREPVGVGSAVRKAYRRKARRR